MTINIRLVKWSTKPMRINIYRLAEWSTKPMTMDTARGVLRETARHLAGFLDSHKKVRQNCGEF